MSVFGRDLPLDGTHNFAVPNDEDLLETAFLVEVHEGADERSRRLLTSREGRNGDGAKSASCRTPQGS